MSTLLQDSRTGEPEKNGDLLPLADKGSVILVGEFSRLDRSALQAMEILQLSAEREVSIVVVKNGIAIRKSMQSMITATILGLPAEIERDFISRKTIEVLVKLKSFEKVLDRPGC